MTILRSILVIFLLLPVILPAQPAETQPGKCYANCFIPDMYQTTAEQVTLTPSFTRTTISAPQFEQLKKYVKTQDECTRFVAKPPVLDTIEERIMVKPPTKKYVIVPPVYKKLSEPVTTPPESKRLISIPAVYETVSEQIQVAPATNTYTVTPAEFETLQEEYELEPAYTKIEVREPKYELVTERVEIKPPSLTWVRKKGDPNCLGADPDDCFVWCLVEEPAEYQEITKRINKGCDGSGIPDAGCIITLEIPAKMASMEVRRLKKPAEIRTEKTEARYQTVYKKIIRDEPSVREEILPPAEPSLQYEVIEKPASVREEVIPGEYLTVRKIVLRENGSYREEKAPAEYRGYVQKILKGVQEERTEIIPAEFITVAKRRLVRPGGFTEWREVLCAETITGYTVRQIQEALKARGYDPGPIDNEMGAKTKEALRQFQQENGLPVGNLDFETLSALGLRF